MIDLRVHPLCECHAEPMARRSDKRPWPWRCAVKWRIAKGRYETTDKGRARTAIYRGSAKGILADVRGNAKRRRSR